MEWLPESERSNQAHLLASMHLSIKKEVSIGGSDNALLQTGEIETTETKKPTTQTIIEQFIQKVLASRSANNSFNIMADKFSQGLLPSNEKYLQLLQRFIYMHSFACLLLS